MSDARAPLNRLAGIARHALQSTQKIIAHARRRANIYWRRYISRATYEQITVWRRRFATGFGAVALGLVALAFAWASDEAQRLFLLAHEASQFLPLLITPLGFALVVYATRAWLPETAGSGIPQVIAVSKDAASAARSSLVSVRTAAAKFMLTIAALMCGGSFGREGPTVQISAAIMIAMHRAFGVPITPGVVLAGGAAGVAAAFNTPLGGIVFAIEELAAAYEQRVAVLVVAAVVIAGLVSLGIAGDYVYFGVMQETLTISQAVMIAPLAGLVCGIAGGYFTRALLWFLRARDGWAGRIKARPISFAAGSGLLVAVIGVVTNGDTFGTGYETSKGLVEGAGHDYWFAPAKYIANLASALTGAPGGLFAPSLSVGAGIGDMLSGLFVGAPASSIVVIGMAAYFTGVVRAPLTAVIIVTEATASRGMLLPMFAAALIAHWASALVCRERLYHGLASVFLSQTAQK